MSFDDVARRMQQRDRGPGAIYSAVDPDEMMIAAERAEKRSRANGDIAFGIILLVAGIAITAMTYDSASRQGGTYIVAFGPIIVGLIKLLRGLANH